MEEKTQNGWKKWAVLVTLSLALAIIIIDGTVLNVSISNIIKDLNTDLKSIQWAITLYSLIIAALTITGGRLGDLFGRKKMFILGAVIFALGSLLTALSPNIGMLILGWSVVEGIGAALMMPATASLLVSTFHGKERAIAFGVWGGIAGVAAALGPILGGFLTTNFSWRWAFGINVFVVAALVAGSFLVKETIDKKHKAQLDFGGVILSALGLGTLVYGIIESSTYGWVSAKKAYEVFGSTYALGGLSITLYAIILGLLIITAFVFYEINIEKNGDTPLVSMKLFFNRQFSSGLLTTTVLSLGQAGLVFVLPVFFESVKEKSALETGFALLPFSLSFLIAAPVSGILSSRMNIKPRLMIQVGILLNLIGTIVLYFTLNVHSEIIDLALGQILSGIGFGFINAQISNLTLSAVEPSKIGEASGLSSMTRQVGSTLGSAIIGAVFIGLLISNVTTSLNESTKVPEKLRQTINTQVNDNGSSLGLKPALEHNSNIPKETKEEIFKAFDEATVEGGKRAQVVVAGFLILCFLISFSLPNKLKEHGTPDTPKGE